MSQACAKEIAKNPLNENGQCGSIVNISSIAALMGFVGLAHYCASKGGIMAMTVFTCKTHYPQRQVRILVA